MDERRSLVQLPRAAGATVLPREHSRGAIAKAGYRYLTVGFGACHPEDLVVV